MNDEFLHHHARYHRRARARDIVLHAVVLVLFAAGVALFALLFISGIR